MLWYTQGELERARTGLNRALALAHAGDMDAVVWARGSVRARRTRAWQFEGGPRLVLLALLKGSGRWRSRGAAGMR